MSKRKRGLFFRIFIATFTLYSLYTFISVQIQINERKNEVKYLSEKIEFQKQKNEQLTSILNSDIDYESIARSKLDYVLPGERVFEDTMGQ